MDDLGKSIPAAEGLIDAETGTQKVNANEFCLNCNTKLLDVFCHHCGQKDIPKRQTLGELWVNFISSFWSYEGKFFQTTKYLITKPGFLAVEYNAGKRESYYHPARMYVFISFVFFLVLVSLPDSDTVKQSMEMNRDDYKEFKKDNAKVNVDSLLSQAAVWQKDSSSVKIPMALVDSVKNATRRKENRSSVKGGINLTQSKYKTVASYDSAQKVLPEKDQDGWFERKIKIREIELNEKYKDNTKQLGKDFLASFSDNFSKVLFWLLPVFALLLKLLYVRRDFYYSEHLVFSIYYYNFFFLAGSLQMIVNQVSWLEWLGTIIGFWIFFYLLFAMKRVYQQSWRKTIFKFVLFSLVFFLCLGVAMGISAVAILMMI